jgi:hypothetical protein
MTAAALAAILVTPAFAQSGSTPMKSDQTSQATMQSRTAASPGSFLDSQNASEWRSSKLVGATVYGPESDKIGDINDLLVDTSGNIKAAVIGVGGFIGVGEKDVAVPFDALTITRKADSAAIDKITLSYSKDELKNAPKFTWYKANDSSRHTTGSSSSGMTKSPSSSTATSPSTDDANTVK